MENSLQFKMSVLKKQSTSSENRENRAVLKGEMR